MKRKTTSELGKIMEDHAEKFLMRSGYIILSRNWRFKKAEIDIVAKKENVLVFVEVKSRSSEYFGAPEISINAQKEAMIIDAAQRYMEQINHTWEIRFDIISLIFDKSLKKVVLKHFKDAYF